MYYKEAGPILDYIRNLFKKKTSPEGPAAPIVTPPIIEPVATNVEENVENAPETPLVEEPKKEPEVPFVAPDIVTDVEDSNVEEYIEFPEVGEETEVPAYPYDGETSPYDAYAPYQDTFEPPETFREWIPPTDVTRYIFDVKKDYSLGALLYLQALGYKEAQWFLSEAHPKYDVCDERAGQTFSIAFLIEHAYRHASGDNPKNKSYIPPSPIFSLSHPGCICYLTCLPPMSVDNIPDNAPGLPIHAKPELLTQYKQILFNNLKVIIIDSITMPPLDLHSANQLEASIRDSLRKKEASSWEEVRNPVNVNTNFISKLPLGFTRPIFTGYKGVELGRHKEHSKVYLLEMNRIVTIPTKYLSTLEMTRSDDIYNIKRGDFIIVDDTLSIVYRVMQNKDIFAFVPDFNHIMRVDEWVLLKEK